jgi:fructose-1,6-bisphosphatase/inositol monophosphatase family enzyme
MAYVACGRLDAGFEEGSWESLQGPKIWDFAAGKLLISEAGGLTRDIEGSLLDTIDERPLDLMKRSFFCASTPSLANEILQAIARGRSDAACERDDIQDPP